MFEIKLECPSDQDAIKYIEYIFSETLTQVSFNKIEEAMFAIREALINAVEASKDIEDKEKSRVSISMVADKQSIEVKIFNFYTNMSGDISEKVVNPSTPENIWSDHGRGLLFINHLVDQVWEERDDKGRFVLGITIKEEQKDV